MSDDIPQDFEQLTKMKVPVKRAAYSDRTAWVMAILAELAYYPFDVESDERILQLAGELAALTSQDQIAARLRALHRDLLGLAPPPQSEEENNVLLRAALAAGGFRLVGVLHRPENETQGYVAVRPDNQGTGEGMAVIVFRGTKQVRDWLTNVRTDAVPIRDEVTGSTIGTMHKGFHDAYHSVHDDIARLLRGHEALPLYITGHSLGGALAVVATWYQSSQRLGACYTFGAPRVGNQDLIDRFRTPIYRILNGPDPVTFVPPSGGFLDALKIVVRTVGVAFPFFGWADWVGGWLVRQQRFRHYGYERYLTPVGPGDKGDYPNLRVEFALSAPVRLMRFVLLVKDGRSQRIDKYHAMREYREKLRAHAIRRYDPADAAAPPDMPDGC